MFKIFLSVKYVRMLGLLCACAEPDYVASCTLIFEHVSASVKLLLVVEKKKTPLCWL